MPTAARMCRWIIWVGLVGLVGCTPTQYASQADRAAYATIASGQKAALGADRSFDVAYQPFRPHPDAPSTPIRVAGKEITIGRDTPTTLTLEDCLEIAFRNSRDFQDEKEDLYSFALELANERRGWDFPLLAGDLTGDAETVRTMKGDSDHSGAGEASLSLAQQFIHGGALTLGVAVNIASDLLGWKTTTVGSLLEANFTQPLLRGAWRGLAYEDQYRLERDFLFLVYDYERFTQTFAAGLATSYYDVLRRRDQLENEDANLKRLEARFLITKALVEGGETRPIEADQVEQDVLEAKVRQAELRQSYENELDQFKLLLGLPIEADVVLNYPGALKELAKAGLKPFAFEESEAIEVALSTRPDVLREHADLRDADRNVEIAADDFLPQLDVALGIDVSGVAPRRFTESRFDRHTRFANATFNYELDQTDNRDAYRNAILDLEKAKRDLEEFVDRVRLEVRESYRDLLRSRETYQIQVQNVVVAERRSKLAELEQKEGLASARDVLEAEDGLRRAQNGRTRALIDYTTTRLTFLGALGMLRVDEKGRIHEREQPFKFDRIGQRYQYVSAD